jgi:hypothetical protein
MISKNKDLALLVRWHAFWIPSFRQRTHRGRLTMNTIEKFATAALALSITLVGAVLVIAPLVIAGPRPM